MQIFCKETQAHLDMNPHLKEKGASSGSLITPELWLKNCRSRSASPTSDRSHSGSPISVGTPSISSVTSTVRPVITLAPPSKLLSNPLHLAGPVRAPNKGLKKKRTSRIQSMTTNNNSVQMLNNNSTPSQKPCTMTTSAQDLRLHPMAPAMQPAGAPAETPPAPQHPPSGFQHHPFMPPPPNLFPMRSPRLQPPFPPHSQQPTESRSFPFGPPPPPVTILVPYPIVLPLPIPIPIPIPLSHFAKLSQPTESATGEAAKNVAPKPQEQQECPEPLDFTKARTEDKEADVDPEPPEELKLPKLKITRLQTKRNLAKELESNRPLRKRKRVIDASSH
uniref:Uncharacterized protein n=1 Tax=Lutzomyia longipalpis TaxID=7200 RepID=A0A1B0CMA1_LUTLO